MDGYRTSGHWQKLDCTETPATITRQPGSHFVTLILDPDHPENFSDFKRAVFVLNILGLSVNSLSTFFFLLQNIPVSAKNHATDAAEGNFTFKDTHKLVNEGLCANWTGDRIVFYKEDYIATDWVGFVRPLP
jgi:hypothetical protein